MKVTRLEDLICRQRARALAQREYQLSGKEPLSRDDKFCDQICSAAVSLMSNIAEGFARYH